MKAKKQQTPAPVLAPDMIDLNAWFSIKEAHTHLIDLDQPVSLPWIYDLIRNNLVASRDVKGHRWISRSSLDAYAYGRRQKKEGSKDA